MLSLRRRRIPNTSFWSLCALGLALVIAPTPWMVIGVVARAMPGWSWQVLITNTKGDGGGLANAILGTLILVAGVVSARRLSYDAALLLIVLVCALIALARVVVTLAHHRE